MQYFKEIRYFILLILITSDYVYALDNTDGRCVLLQDKLPFLVVEVPLDESFFNNYQLTSVGWKKVSFDFLPLLRSYNLDSFDLVPSTLSRISDLIGESLERVSFGETELWIWTGRESKKVFLYEYFYDTFGYEKEVGRIRFCITEDFFSIDASVYDVWSKNFLISEICKLATLSTSGINFCVILNKGWKLIFQKYFNSYFIGGVTRTSSSELKMVVNPENTASIIDILKDLNLLVKKEVSSNSNSGSDNGHSGITYCPPPRDDCSRE